MTLVRFDPFRDLANMQTRLSRALSDVQHGWQDNDTYGAWVPPVEIFESGDDLVIRAEIPGVEKEDIEINVENGTLVLSGERKRHSEIKEDNAYRLERIYGSFNRSFRLPTTVDAGRIAAKYHNGVLEITLPKLEEAKPRKVEIEVH